MTRLNFLGSMHDDPDGPTRLHRALKNVTAKYQAAPDFVAFEWAKPTYDALICKRNELREFLIDKLPGLKEGFAARFSNTLGYEGDLQQNIEISTKAIWMLNGRTQDDLSIAGDSLVKRAVSRKMSD